MFSKRDEPKTVEDSEEKIYFQEVVNETLGISINN